MEEKTGVRNWGETQAKTGGKLHPILIPDLGGIEATDYHVWLFFIFIFLYFLICTFNKPF